MSHLDGPFYVVAGNYAEFQQFCKKKAGDDKFYIYVPGIDALRGLDSINGCFYGSYESRKDIDDIRNMIAAIKARKTVGAIGSSIQPTTITVGTNGISTSQITATSTVSSTDLLTATMKAVKELKKMHDDLEAKVNNLLSKNN